MAKYSPKEWLEKGTYFQYEEYEIFTIEGGDGAAILLLHGFPTSSWDWSWIWNDLRQSHRLVALDFLGFGYSDKPKDHTYSFNEQVEIVLALLKELEITKCHILSHDYGDTVVQEILARYNAGELAFEIDGVFMLNGGIFPEKIQFRFIQRLLLSPIGFLVSKLLSRKRFHKSFGAIFGEKYKPSEDLLDDFWEIIKTNDGHRIGHKLIKYIDERFDYRDRWVRALINFEQPLMFAVGLEDPVSGRLMADRYEELISDQIIRWKNVGHYPQVETPKLVFDTYLEFLDSI